jgi:amino-acid N-acetyltransferase
MVVSDRLRVAEERALAAVYLLTTTAPEYFAELGFSRVERASAPEAMQSSSEFASICPASATCMVKMLR